MKKIVIISYFFPPCNLTASQRVYGWAKYLHHFGYYPIIITRSWENSIKYPEDILTNSGNEIKIEKFEHYEVHRLPYNSSLRDIFFQRNEHSFYKYLSKIFTLIYVLLEKYFNFVIPSRNLYEYSKNIILKQNINLFIVSGNPFIQFKFGYLIYKQLKVKWLADYRDGWYTRELVNPKKGFKGLIVKYDASKEKKWVSSAEAIISVSEMYVKDISKFVNKKGFIIENGYDFDGNNYLNNNIKNKFILTYNGTLYPEQPIEVFLEIIIELIKKYSSSNFFIEINFPGLAFEKKQLKRIQNLIVGFEKHFKITGRIAHHEVLKMQNYSDLLIMISYGNLKGIPSSKLYEYIGMKKPILLFPNDFDIIESMLKETRLGIICNNKTELYSKIENMILKKLNNDKICPEPNLSKIEFYSRQNQTKLLAKILDKYYIN